MEVHRESAALLAGLRRFSRQAVGMQVALTVGNADDDHRRLGNSQSNNMRGAERAG